MKEAPYKRLNYVLKQDDSLQVVHSIIAALMSVTFAAILKNKSAHEYEC